MPNFNGGLIKPPLYFGHACPPENDEPDYLFMSKFQLIYIDKWVLESIYRYRI